MSTRKDCGGAGMESAGGPGCRRVFFVVGSPRSGTTLLRTMLAAHPDICIPHETEFFMRVPVVGGALLRKAVAEYVRSGPFENQELDGDSLIEGLNRGALGTRADVFLEMMSRHARRAGKTLAGEKSPHHCRHVEAIAREIPLATFIHIQRDPRDVVASRLGVYWSGRSAASSARSWAGIAREHRRLMGTMPAARYTQVQFEALLASPERELRRLCSFLAMDFDPAMLRFDERARAGQQRADPMFAGLTARPLEAGAAGRHRDRMDPRHVAAVQRFAGSEMVRAGYALDPVPFRADWLARDFGELVGERLSSVGRSCKRRLGIVQATPASLAWNRGKLRPRTSN